MLKRNKNFKIDIMRDGYGLIAWRKSKANSIYGPYISDTVWSIFHHWHNEYLDFSLNSYEDDYYLLSDHFVDMIINIKTYNDLCDLVNSIEEKRWKQKMDKRTTIV